MWPGLAWVLGSPIWTATCNRKSSGTKYRVLEKKTLNGNQRAARVRGGRVRKEQIHGLSIRV